MLKVSANMNDDVQSDNNLFHKLPHSTHFPSGLNDGFDCYQHVI